MGRLTPKAETSLTEDPKSTIKYFDPHIIGVSLMYIASPSYIISYLPWHLSVPSRKTARYLAPIGQKVGVSLTRTGTLYPIIERNKGAIET